MLLFGIMAAGIVLPDKEKSEEENRMLAQKPKATVESVTSGDFMEEFESYVSDQFAGRSGWRSAKVFLSRLGGSKMENGVYIGRKGQLMEEIDVPREEDLAQNINAVNQFAADYPEVSTSVMLVPDSACVLDEELPLFAKPADQKEMIGGVKENLDDPVKWIDAVSALEEHRDEKIYYKTDHHWTSLGAFYAFQKAAPVLGIEEDVKKRFKAYPVSTTFNGVLASTSGVHLDEEEQIDIYVPKESEESGQEMIVDYVEEGLRKSTIYDTSMLKTKGQYAVFMGGNRSIIDIRTLSPGKERLLLVKDSYANCFIQFLTPYFREIVIVDPRYYGGTLQDVMHTYRITDVLFLYRGNTFFTDNHIPAVVQKAE